MAKIRGNSMYAEPGDKNFAHGEEHPKMKEIKKFCDTVLSDTFENWVLICSDDNARNFKEVENGELMKGVVICKINGMEQKDKRTGCMSKIAMLMLDAIEGFCQSEEETERFLDALLKTAQKVHREDAKKDGNPTLTNKEVDKLDILKGFWGVCVDAFDDYKGKEAYIESCLASAIPALLLHKAKDEDIKNSIRADMKKGIDGKNRSKILDSSRELVETVDYVMDLVDEGKDPSDVIDLLNSIIKSREAKS